jgi:hypothetical protein
MTALGWISLITSVTLVWALSLWCYYKVLSFKEEPPKPVTDFHSA